MATKSDFAQKLLYDLRLRKQRLAASHDTATDTYRNAGPVHRGSRHTKALESVGGSKTANKRPTSSGGGRALGIQESSRQIVSYGGGQHGRSESVGDLSMAFAYAMKTHGKLAEMAFSGSTNGNTMIDFLHQIGRRSADVGTGKGTSLVVKHRPSNGLSNVQIQEISKGVQNLYEILKSGSNGMNLDKYTMEVGKQLLKGAQGLEESLRMLVNLQEASEKTVRPQRKSRVTLLEVDENDEDVPSKTDDDHKQVALPRFSFDKPSKKKNTHLAITHAADHSNRSLGSKSEKGKFSNVIAKLMGLEEIPGRLDSDSQSDMMVVMKAPYTKNATQRTREREKQGNKTSPVTNSLVSSKPREDFGGVYPTKGMPEPHRSRQRRIGDRSDQMHENRQKSTETVDTRQERTEKKKTVQLEKSNAIRLVPRGSPPQESAKRTPKQQHNHGQQKSKASSKPMPPPIQPTEESLKAKKALVKNLTDGNTKKTAPLKKQESQPETTLVKGKPPQVPITRKKADSVAVHRNEAHRKRRNGVPNSLGRPSKHKLSVMQEMKREDTEIIELNKPEIGTKGKIQIHDISEVSTTLDIKALPEDNIQNGMRDHDQSPTRRDIVTPTSQETPENLVAGAHEGSIESAHLPQNKHKKSFYSSIQVVLTEPEKQLKEILIKDQLFLNTAEVLFKLNIPVGFLHENHHGDQETKLKLDCGYEILRRKARTQELSVHPYMKPPLGSRTIRYLDDLVKQLYKDLERLRNYGKDAQDELDEADYLHRMLDRDIYNKHPDINSFWDFGWHTTSFAFVEKDEFAKDVERDVLHTLIDEITEDLLSLALPF